MRIDEHRRERQRGREHERAAEADDARVGNDRRITREHEADRGQREGHAHRHERPAPHHEPPGKEEQQQRRGNLQPVVRGERGIQQLGPSHAMQHVREERVGGEVDARAPAGDEPEAPRDRRLPVGPPYARLLVHGLRGPAALVEHARESDEEDGHGPRHERQSPIAAGERQHDGNRERRGERLAHQEPVRIDGGPERDLARHPLAHDGRQRGLHDRDADAHHEGRGEEHRGIRRRAAQRGS